MTLTHTVLPLPIRRWSLALVAVAALTLLLGAAPARAADERFVATELPDSPVGRQMSWLMEASTRLPLSDAELRAHISEPFLALPGASPAELNQGLGRVIDAGGLRLVGLVVVEPDALVAIVTGRGGQELVVTLGVDGAGMIGQATIQAANSGSEVTLPAPGGRAAVGTDVVALVDRARGDRRLMLTRWYPAATGARERPLAAYASPRLTATLALPTVRVHARHGARARSGRLPVVLFSPGFGGSRILYQALAEDLASHGYLVLAVDHTGEAPVEFPDGRIGLPSAPSGRPERMIATAAATRLADMRLVLRRLTTMTTGPRADRRRVAAIGHSLGGSTAAALMRAEPAVRAGVDMDGSIFGTARRGVPRAFLVMTGGGGPDPSIRGLLERSRGPRLALELAGLEHMSFSDLPAIAPEAFKTRSARTIAVQRAYLRAFLDRYLRDQRSRLLEGPSTRWPQVSVRYRRECCA
jgi:dienelactone hydrolase